MKISNKLFLLFNNTIAKIKTTYNNYISRYEILILSIYSFKIL